MAYIGKQPIIGNFVKLDAISVVNGQASYTMQNGGANFTAYETVNQFLVSLNGILQAPTTSFTVASSTITFASNLVTGDVIDFILVLGNTLDIGTVSDNTISTAKIVDGAITSAKLGSGVGGKVLQVVQASTTTQTTIASTTYTDTTLTASITPSSTSSKILIMVSQANYVYRNTNARVVASIQLLRGATSVFESAAASGIQAGTAANGYVEVWNQTPLHYLDSPSTTSSTTYKTQMKVETTANGASVRCQASEPDGSGQSTITLIEVSA